MPTLLYLYFASAAIFRCELADGAIAFSQFPCTDAIESRPIAVSPPNIIADGALSAEELAALSRLDTEMHKQAQQRRATKARTQRQRARESAIRATSCSDGQRRLEKLRDFMRRGYRLEQSARLEEELANLREVVERDC